MADSVEMQDIRGLDIDKAVKGFALVEYVFKNDCAQSSGTGDQFRWYSETAADLTATAPQTNVNISPLSTFPTLEVTWTRNTGYYRKYANEDFISMEDQKSTDVDVYARTLLRLTRAVIKQVDTRIFNVLTEYSSATGLPAPTNIQTFATTAVGGDQWDAPAYAADPFKDIMHARKLIMDYDYDTSNAVLYIDPVAYEALITWLVSGKGSSVPQFASEKIQTGEVMNLGGVRIKVSRNVTTDYAVMFIKNKSCTWRTHTSITSRAIEEAGIGTRIRVWELGEAYLTDPKSVVLITDINT